jgi:trk system potassium uptake protein TrkA
MRQFAVIGLGQFGSSVARTLARLGAEVIGIDSDPNRVEAIKNDISHAVVLDATREESMREVGVQDVDTAVVSIGENQHANILVTAILRRMGIPRIYARAMNSLQGQILELVGAHDVLYIEDLMGEQVGKSILRFDVFDQIPLTSGDTLLEISAPVSFVGRTLSQLDLRVRYRVNVVAIKKRVAFVKDDGTTDHRVEVRDVPDPEAKIEADDRLIIIGSPENLERMSQSS